MLKKVLSLKIVLRFSLFAYSLLGYSRMMAAHPSTLFVYGSLKPDELGFRQIEDMVSEYIPALLCDFALYVRDGLPIIGSSPGDEVEGFLLKVDAEKEDDFWKVVNEYEGTTNYKLDNSIITVSEEKEHLTSAFVGRKMNRGNPVKLNSVWTCKRDPIFSQSFPLLHSDISENSLRFTDAEDRPREYWTQLHKLLSQYLLLVSILEHLTVVKFGGSKKQEPMVRIRKLQQSQECLDAFKELKEEKHNPSIKVSDSRAIEDSLSSSNPEQALFAWYQVRSNLQHRGKASLYDANLVQKSCIGLSNFLFEYLKVNIHGIDKEWEKLIGVKLTKVEFMRKF